MRIAVRSSRTLAMAEERWRVVPSASTGCWSRVESSSTARFMAALTDSSLGATTTWPAWPSTSIASPSSSASRKPATPITAGMPAAWVKMAPWLPSEPASATIAATPFSIASARSLRLSSRTTRTLPRRSAAAAALASSLRSQCRR